VIFHTPNKDRQFEIPDDWWLFAEMNTFSPHECGFYLFWPDLDKQVEVVPIVEVEPVVRAPGVPLFKKYSLLPILFGK
jgi:hypothetical protein